MNRKIVWKNYDGANSHLYEDELGFSDTDRQNAGGLTVPKDIFVKLLDECHFELGFFCVDNGTNYFLATLETPMQFLELPRNKELSQYAQFQCDSTEYSVGRILTTVEKAEDLWNNYRIDGKSMEEIINRSYITWLC